MQEEVLFTECKQELRDSDEAIVRKLNEWRTTRQRETQEYFARLVKRAEDKVS